MYYANNEGGVLVNAVSAEPDREYTCPACGSPLVVKQGSMVAHHFAHKNGKVCDLRYFHQMSRWHRKMQEKFLENMREIKVWNREKTEFQIADVLVTTEENKYIFEFQHSTISGDEFVKRTEFYLNLGYKVVWIFDFKEIEKPKCFFYEEAGDDAVKHVVWTGNNRVRMFDSTNVRLFFDDVMCNSESDVQVLFYISTGVGRKRSYEYNGHSVKKWEFVNPLIREAYYIKPIFCLKNKLSDFYAIFYTEDEIDAQIRSFNKKYPKNMK